MASAFRREGGYTPSRMTTHTCQRRSHLLLFWIERISLVFSRTTRMVSYYFLERLSYTAVRYTVLCALPCPAHCMLLGGRICVSFLGGRALSTLRSLLPVRCEQKGRAITVFVCVWWLECGVRRRQGLVIAAKEENKAAKKTVLYLTYWCAADPAAPAGAITG